jgi:hypothetical protein
MECPGTRNRVGISKARLAAGPSIADARWAPARGPHPAVASGAGRLPVVDSVVFGRARICTPTEGQKPQETDEQYEYEQFHTVTLAVALD